MVFQASAALTDSCTSDGRWACQWVLDGTNNRASAGTVDFLVDKPLTVAIIAIVAFIVNWLIRRAINRFVDHIAGSNTSGIRGAARAQAIGGVLRSLSTIVIYGIAFLTVLGEIGIDLAPLLAGAGVAGIALGFGAQTLVRDFLAGIFILLEDQMGVGDVVDVGEAIGIVEQVTLRETRIRDLHGTVWHVPNGEITRVANMSQDWGRAVLDVPVAYGTDVRHASEIMKRVADEVRADEMWRANVLDEPEIWGVQSLDPDGMTIRMVVRTAPAVQFGLMRELRARLHDAFQAEGIEIPFPQRTMWVRHNDDSQNPLAPTANFPREAPPDVQRE